MDRKGSTMKLTVHRYVLTALVLTLTLISRSQDTLIFKKRITDNLNPKSVVHSGDGLFAAQNMMYKHTVTFFDRNYNTVYTVHDDVDLSKFDSTKKSMIHWGAPVEGTYSDHGKYYWVSNYSMVGEGYNKPGCDVCDGKHYDKSYVYKINTWNFQIEDAIEVGSVPKYIEANDQLKIVVVSNWTSGDIHVISTVDDKVIKKISVGDFPRGIAINPTRNKIYVALMGETRIAVIDMKTWQVNYVINVGRALRHLCLDEKRDFLYVSINDEGKIGKIKLSDYSITYCESGKAPRSMSLTSDGKYLYVVNNLENTVSKINTESFTVVHKAKTGEHPIGVTLDEKMGDVWVACYTGSLMIYHDPSIVVEDNWLAFFEDFFPGKPAAIIPPKVEVKVPPTKEIEKTEPVKIDVPKESPKELKPLDDVSNELVESTSKEDWIIVAGSFKSKALADKYHQQIIEDGYQSEILLKKNGFYLITCGSAPTLEKIEVLLKKVKKDYGEVWIAKRGN
ncbi:MAG: SPOR domain-containing protein [Bacteroidetes bacterium]|nr:SPOR domain-containing protein [Bacteroidota bacterium]